MTQDLAYRAMLFSREAHASQARKYTGNPYTDHLAEVAGIVSTVTPSFGCDPEIMIAVSWLHDYIEDVSPDDGGNCGWHDLETRFGEVVANGVRLLSDMETGSRADRKAESRIRLAAAPGWVQTIKCADLISNTSSIVKHDPKFAVTYLEEKRLLLEVMGKAHPGLRELAASQAKAQEGASNG